LGATLFLCLYILYKRKENNKVDNHLYPEKEKRFLLQCLCFSAMAVLLFSISCSYEYFRAVDSSPFAAPCYQGLTIGIRVVVGICLCCQDEETWFLESWVSKALF
jgi:hypothetical protein